MKIKKVLSEKKVNTVEFISSESSVIEAIDKMVENDIGSLLVKDSKGSFRGIITERDIMKAVLDHTELLSVKVSEVMSHDLLVVNEDNDVEHVMKVMSKKHVRHIPVIDPGNKIIGIVSIRDMVDSLLEEKDIEIHHLSDFVGGTSRNRVY